MSKPGAELRGSRTNDALKTDPGVSEKEKKNDQGGECEETEERWKTKQKNYCRKEVRDEKPFGRPSTAERAINTWDSPSTGSEGLERKNRR